MEITSKPNTNLSFDNTAIAFSSKTDKDLTLSYWLFKVINSNFLVKIGPPITTFAMNIGLPISPIIRATIFKQFCGGESISDCEKTINHLGEFAIGTILDYSVEGEETEAAFDQTCTETIATIHKAASSKNIPFSVFKVTGLGAFTILEKIQAKDMLSAAEQAAWERVKARVEKICATAAEKKVRIFIDAEESWIQVTIDDLANEMMAKFNKTEIIVYNTYQFYRHDRLAYLQNCVTNAKSEGYKIGAKLVRGAYMEKERKRAIDMGYESPIQPTKATSDKDYDAALAFCIQHIDSVAICAGTHNENSSLVLVKLMSENNIPANHPHIFFSQLLGMSDNLSFNLAKAGYNVAKYVPYGPVKAVLPYLFRRANENTAIAGQMGRELSLIISERKRRKN